MLESQAVLRISIMLRAAVELSLIGPQEEVIGDQHPDEFMLAVGCGEGMLVEGARIETVLPAEGLQLMHRKLVVMVRLLLRCFTQHWQGHWRGNVDICS